MSDYRVNTNEEFAAKLLRAHVGLYQKGIDPVIWSEGYRKLRRAQIIDFDRGKITLKGKFTKEQILAVLNSK